MIIRPLEIKDEQIYAVLSSEFYSSPAVLEDIPLQFRLNAFKELLRGVYCRGFLFECHGEAAGYGIISFFYSQESGGLCTVFEEIYVREQFRSMGLGKRYFDYIFKNFSSPRYFLEVEKSNGRARKLYENLGFKPLKYIRMFKSGEIN